MIETYSVDCPGCGETKGSMTNHAGTIGVHCSCGVTFSVDIGDQTVDEWHQR